jgi:hypothetical protein
MAALRQPPRLWLTVAALLPGAALGGAAILHVVGHGGGHLDCNTRGPRPLGCFHEPDPGWVDLAALGICVLGVGLAAGVLVTVRRPKRG